MPLTPAEVRRLWPRLVNPPHAYYDVKNEKGSSPFKAGLPSADYQPFMDYFAEREQTARAQARLDARKGRGEIAARYLWAALGWAQAREACAMRQTKAILAEVLERQKRDLSVKL